MTTPTTTSTTLSPFLPCSVPQLQLDFKLPQCPREIEGVEEGIMGWRSNNGVKEDNGVEVGWRKGKGNDGVKEEIMGWRRE